MLPGAVLLLDAADAVLEAGGAGDRPGAGQGLRVALVRPEDLGAVGAVCGWAPARTAPAGPAVRRRPGSATARSRWRGSRRRAGRPGCGRSARSGPPPGPRRSSRRGCAGRRSAPAPRRCVRTSPGAGRPARSWSAGRWRGRRAGCRRSAAAVRARPRGRSSPTSAPHRGRTSSSPPSEPPKAAPSAAPMPAISSSAWKVRTPKFLCRDSSCRMSEAGVIGYEPRNSGRSACWDGGDQPVGQGQVAGDVAVGAGREGRGGGGDLVGDGEVLGGLAEVPAGPEGGDVRLGDLAASWRTWCAGTSRCPRWAGGTSRTAGPSANMFFAALGVLAGQVEVLERLDGQRGQRHRVHAVAVERAVLQRAGRRSRPWPSRAW